MKDALTESTAGRLRSIRLSINDDTRLTYLEKATFLEACDEIARALDEAPQIPKGYARHLMHEAMTQQVFQILLTRSLLTDGVLIKRDPENGDTTPGAMHPAVEGLAKANERYRKIWKEILAHNETTPETGAPQSFPKQVESILNGAKGTDDHAIEHRQSNKLSD